MPTISTKVPVLGHVDTQDPLEMNGALVLLQLMHSELAGPLQVPHVESQLLQTKLLLAYLPTGVHEARHVPVPEPR